jgi:hypothetical protein
VGPRRLTSVLCGNLYPIMLQINDLETRAVSAPAIVTEYVDHAYLNVTNVFNSCTSNTVTFHRKNVYIFWWNQELDCSGTPAHRRVGRGGRGAVVTRRRGRGRPASVSRRRVAPRGCRPVIRHHTEMI